MQSNDREEKEIEIYEISDSEDEIITAVGLREAAIQAAATQNQPVPFSPSHTLSAAIEVIDLTEDGDSEDDDDESEEREDEYEEYIRLSRPLESNAFQINHQRKRISSIQGMSVVGKKRKTSSNDTSLKYQFESLDIRNKHKCKDCRFPFTSSQDTILSHRGKRGYCKGCYRLERTCRWEDMDDIRHWLLTGELNREIWENDVFNSNEEHRVKKVVSSMRGRLVKNKSFLGNSSSSRPPSFEKLFNLYINCECKCAVTGWTCHFSQSRQNSWSVTFDHIVPLSIAPPGFDPWDISNIQVMSYLMNNIKGDLPDHEIHRWFRVWKMGQLDRE